MSDGTIMAAAAMTVLQRRLEAIAANLASARVPGYQPRLVNAKSFYVSLDEATDVLVESQEAIDFRQGAIVRDEGNPLAVAIRGEGFFEIQTPGGVRYTRNGDFQLAADGAIMTRAGYPVLGSQGPLRATPDGGTLGF